MLAEPFEWDRIDKRWTLSIRMLYPGNAAAKRLPALSETEDSISKYRAINAETQFEHFKARRKS
jgi:hypothetical protein